MGEVEAFMIMINQQVHLHPDKFQKLLIAVSEVVINSIVHGNREQQHKKVAIFAEFDDKVLIVKIADEGNGFHLESLQDPTIPENLTKESGRGIFIAKSLVDEFSYEHNDKGSVFTLLVRK